MSDLHKRRTVRLTTRGRKSGQPRTVTVWFVPSGPSTIWVQHATRAPAYWYRNLSHDPAVTVDFGDGPIAARATPITDPTQVQEVLRRIRRRYLLGHLVQLFGRGARAVAAEISW